MTNTWSGLVRHVLANSGLHILDPSHHEIANTAFNIFQSNHIKPTDCEPPMRVAKIVSCRNFSVLQKSRRYQAQLLLRIGLSLLTGQFLWQDHLQQLFDGSVQAAKLAKLSKNVSMKHLSNAASRLSPDMKHHCRAHAAVCTDTGTYRHHNSCFRRATLPERCFPFLLQVTGGTHQCARTQHVQFNARNWLAGMKITCPVVLWHDEKITSSYNVCLWFLTRHWGTSLWPNRRQQTPSYTHKLRRSLLGGSQDLLRIHNQGFGNHMKPSI